MKRSTFFFATLGLTKDIQEMAAPLRLLLVVQSGLRRSSADYAAEIHSRRMFSQRPNQALERTADRRENLLSMTSTLNPEAQLALIRMLPMLTHPGCPSISHRFPRARFVSGRSAPSR